MIGIWLGEYKESVAKAERGFDKDMVENILKWEGGSGKHKQQQRGKKKKKKKNWKEMKATDESSKTKENASEGEIEGELRERREDGTYMLKVKPGPCSAGNVQGNGGVRQDLMY